MKSKYVQVLIVFTIVFVANILTELVPYQYLGDWKCKGGETIEVLTHYPDGTPYYHDKPKGCSYAFNFSNGNHNPKIHWGFRHWILIIAGLTFFIWRLIDIGSK
jgi:hypothetical protein